MKVDTMRFIDYYAGIVLCFILSLFNLFLKTKKISPKNILLIELSEMGSTILADPTMRFLQQQNTTLHFVIFKQNKSSLSILRTIPDNNIYCINESNFYTLALSTIKFLLWCRKKNIDTAIDLELFSRFTAILSFCSGAKNRVGFHKFYNEGLYRGNLLTHKVLYNPHIHITKNFMSLAQSLYTNPQTPFLKKKITDKSIQLQKLKVGEQQKQQIQQKLTEAFSYYNAQHNLILINPNASELLPQRCWAKKNYIKLSKQILQMKKNIFVGITGSKSEYGQADDIRKQIADDRVLNLAGFLPLEQMPFLYSISKLMITNDSGPAHFASTTNLKTFVLFGPETPKLYGSLGNSVAIYANLACSPCVSATNHRKTPCNDNKCLAAISVDDVFVKIKPFL
jgi:ADP-heptose:LPS heptosyltransferase